MLTPRRNASRSNTSPGMRGPTGGVIGDGAVLVADTQATPAMAADVIRRVREVTDKPFKYVVLMH